MFRMNHNDTMISVLVYPRLIYRDDIKKDSLDFPGKCKLCGIKTLLYLFKNPNYSDTATVAQPMV